VSAYNAVTDKVIISPEEKSLTISEMEGVFDRAGAVNETIFRRLEFNQVIRFTKGVGIDIGCGLNKIHSAAIGIDFQLGDKDFGYPFGANIKVAKNKDWLPLPWFKDESLDFVFSSHCLEHFSKPGETIREIFRLLKPGGYLVLILPDMRYYPEKGEPRANPDHEWDCYPQVVVDIVTSVAQFKIVQLDTLHEKLKNLKLTPRDERIAAGYGHKSLNFSFEGIFQKL
jgi:SAM-dependent methyltransferase